MKKLLFSTLLLLSFVTVQAQDVDQIIKQDIRVQATAKTVKQGIEKLDKKCSEAPSPNCNKGKAFGYYILSSRYYAVANSLIGLDADLQQQAVNKAVSYYNKASQLLPAENLTDQQKYLLLDEKSNYEEAID